MPIYPAIIVLSLLVIFLVIYAIIRYTRGREEKLGSLADGLGMEIVKGRWWDQSTLYGTYGDKDLVIRNIYHSTGKSGYYTYKVNYILDAVSPEKVTVNISRLGPGSWFFINLARGFGMKVVDFDDSEFKSAAMVRSRNEDFARRLIDYEIQQDIKNLAKGKITVKGSEVIYEDYGMAQDNEERIHAVLPILGKIDRKLEKMVPGVGDGYSESGLSKF